MLSIDFMKRYKQSFNVCIHSFYLLYFHILIYANVVFCIFLFEKFLFVNFLRKKCRKKFLSMYLVFCPFKCIWKRLWDDGATRRNGILLPKLFWPTVRENCCSDREKLLKFEAEGQEFEMFLISLEQFIQTVKGQNNFV